MALGFKHPPPTNPLSTNIVVDELHNDVKGYRSSNGKFDIGCSSPGLSRTFRNILFYIISASNS